MTHTIKYPRDSKTEAFDLQIKKILEKLGKCLCSLRITEVSAMWQNCCRTVCDILYDVEYRITICKETDLSRVLAF